MASINAKNASSSSTTKPKGSPPDIGRGKTDIVSEFSSDSDDDDWLHLKKGLIGGGRSANDPSNFELFPRYNKYRDSKIGENVTGRKIGERPTARPDQDYDRSSGSPKKGPGYAALTQSRINKTTPGRSTTFPADGNFRERINAMHPSTRSRDRARDIPGERRPLGTLKQPRQRPVRNASLFDSALLGDTSDRKGKSVVETGVVDSLTESDGSSPFQPVPGGESENLQQEVVMKTPPKQMLPAAALRLDNWIENNGSIPKPMVDRRGRGRQGTELGWASHIQTCKVEPFIKTPPRPQFQRLVENAGIVGGPSMGRRNREGYLDDMDSSFVADGEAKMQSHPFLTGLKGPVEQKVAISLLLGDIERADRTSIGRPSLDRQHHGIRQDRVGYESNVSMPSYGLTSRELELLVPRASASIARQSVKARSQRGRQENVASGSNFWRDEDVGLVLEEDVEQSDSSVQTAFRLTRIPLLVSNQFEAKKNDFNDRPNMGYEGYSADDISAMQTHAMLDEETSSEEEARLAAPVRPKLTSSSPSTWLDVVPAVGGPIGKALSDSGRRIPNPVALRPWNVKDFVHGRAASPADIAICSERRPGRFGLEDQRYDRTISKESRAPGASRGPSMNSQPMNMPVAGGSFKQRVVRNVSQMPSTGRGVGSVGSSDGSSLRSVRQIEAMSEGEFQSDDQSLRLAAHLSVVSRINPPGSSRHSTQTKTRISNNFKSSFTDNKSKTLLRANNRLSVVEVKKVSKASNSASSVGPSLQKRQAPQSSLYTQDVSPNHGRTQLGMKTSSMDQPTLSSRAKQREQARKSPSSPRQSRAKQPAVMPQLSTNQRKHNPRSSLGPSTGQLRAPASLPTVATSNVSVGDMNTVAFYDMLRPGQGYRPDENKKGTLFFKRQPCARNQGYLRNTGATGRQAFVQEFGREWESRYEDFVSAWEAVEAQYGKPEDNDADQLTALPAIPAAVVKKSHTQQIVSGFKRSISKTALSNLTKMPSVLSLPLKENLSGRSTSGPAAFDQSKKQTSRPLSPCEIFETENSRFADDDFRCVHDAKSMLYWAGRFSSLETQWMNDSVAFQKSIELAIRFSKKSADRQGNTSEWDSARDEQAVGRAIDVFDELWDLCKTEEARHSLKDYKIYFAREKGWHALLPAGVTMKEQPAGGMSKMAGKVLGTRETRLQQREQRDADKVANGLKRQPSRLPVPRGLSPRACTPQAPGGRTWWGGRKPAPSDQVTSSPMAQAAARAATKENKRPGQPH